MSPPWPPTLLSFSFQSFLWSNIHSSLSLHPPPPSSLSSSALSPDFLLHLLYWFVFQLLLIFLLTWYSGVFLYAPNLWSFFDTYIHVLTRISFSLRWRPQHFSPVRPACPHHYRGHAGKQRHRPPAEHVPGAFLITSVGYVPGRCVSGAVCAHGGRFHLQHTAGPGCGAGRDPEHQLLCCSARRKLLPVWGPGGAAVPEQAETDVTDTDGGQSTCTTTSTKNIDCFFFIFSSELHQVSMLLTYIIITNKTKQL